MAGTKLKLGFFLLKNPSPLQLKENISWVERTELERQFFHSSPWKEQNLDLSRVGVEKLRVFLQDLLDSHIERELPKVRREVQALMLRTDNELKGLGAERSSIGQIRMFLAHLSMDFYNVVKAASEDTYDGKDGAFFDTESLKGSTRLRALVHQENGSLPPTCGNSPRDEKCTHPMIRIQMSKESFPQHVTTHSRNMVSKQSKVNCNLPRKKCSAGSNRYHFFPAAVEIYQLINEIYLSTTRGRELPGNYNHALLSELFHEQSSRWADIAKDHLQKLSSLVTKFVRAALAHVIRDYQVRANVQKIVDVQLERNELGAYKELQRLLDNEKAQPITYNHYFTDNIQKCRQKSLKKQIQGSMNEAIQQDWNGKFHVSNSSVEIGKLVASLQKRVIVNMDKQACSEALIGLKAYYKVCFP